MTDLEIDDDIVTDPDVAPTVAGSTLPARTRGLRPGDPNFGRVRHPPLLERIGTAAAGVLGEDLGSLVHHVFEGIKRKSISASAGRLVLERLLPPGRPIRIDLPAIHTVADLGAAQDLILAALNEGRITPGEARELQEVAVQALRSRREAEPPPPAFLDDPAERRRIICEAAALYGMCFPEGEDRTR